MKKIFIYLLVFAVVLLVSFSYLIFGVAVAQSHVVKTERASSDALPGLLNESAMFETSWNFCCFIRRFKHLKPGEYPIEEGTSAWALVEQMRKGDPSSILIRTDESRTLLGFCEQLGGNLQFKKEDYLTALCNAMQCDTTVSGIARATPLLFADTYDFQYSDSPQSVATRFKKYYDVFWNQERLKQADDVGLTAHEIYTLASVVKGECKLKEEAGQIARLYLNRLKKGMLLQCDATIQFIVQRENAQRILEDDLKMESPYNTYKVPGLPPGPIFIVEQYYIDAILQAPLHRYIYMCAKDDGSGEHLFTDNFGEHSRNAIAYRRYMDKLEIRK